MEKNKNKKEVSLCQEETEQGQEAKDLGPEEEWGHVQLKNSWKINVKITTELELEEGECQEAEEEDIAEVEEKDRMVLLILPK